MSIQIVLFLLEIGIDSIIRVKPEFVVFRHAFVSVHRVFDLILLLPLV